MNRTRHLRIYDLHSWTGITLGLFVFVVAFSGCLALFYHEVLAWEDPAKRIELTERSADFQPTFSIFMDERMAEGEVEFATVFFPTAEEPYYQVFAHVEPEDGEHKDWWIRWHPQTLEQLPSRGEGMAIWLYDFHRDLMWPAELGGRTIGRTIVGVAGVILMLALVSGVVIHTKIREELFSLRFLRSVRLKWQDTHKVLGLWGFPFYAMIAFTGAFLGIVAILAPIIAVLAFKGDQEALIEAVLGAPEERAGVSALMVSIDEVRQLQHFDIEGGPAYALWRNYGDANASVEVFFKSDKRLALYEPLYVDGVTGEIDSTHLEDNFTPANRTTAAMAPLHYGTFGGLWLKLLYLVLGVALAAITAMGNMMWVERRLHGNDGHRSEAFYRGLSRLTVGVTCGIGVASAVLLHHDKFYFGAEAARLFWTGWTYFGVWALGIVYAFIRRDEYRATKEMIGLGGLLLVLAPLTNGIMTGDFAWKALLGASHSGTAGVDVAFLLIGSLVIAIAVMLPQSRPEGVRKRASPHQIEADLETAPAE